MASTKFMISAALLAAASGVAFAPAAFAQNAAATETVVYSSAQVADVVAQLQAASTDAEVQAILTTALTASPTSAPAILKAYKAVNPAGASKLFRQMVAILSTNEANEGIIQALMEQNEDLVAQNASEVEPAAGDETSDNANFSVTDSAGGESAVTGENPSQLNSPAEEESGLSPVKP